MRMLVLGAGLQGSACAYDLLQDPEVEQVRLADLKIDHLPPFLAPYSGKRLIPTPLDVRDRDATLGAMRDVDSVMSALPYYFNLDAAKLAVEAGAHFSDLGGNTEIVFQQRELDAAAQKKGVTVIPDCGLAPGMVNILAEYGIQQLDSVDSIRIYVGGLPQEPGRRRSNYQIVYSIEGVLDYYTTLSWILRDGKRTQIEAFSEREPVRFDAPVGELEAFHTAGGLSTLGFRYEGKIPTMEYKTLRYPGHAHIMEAIRALGLLDLEPVRRQRRACGAARRLHRHGGRASAQAERQGPRCPTGECHWKKSRHVQDDQFRDDRPVRRRPRHQRHDAHHRLLLVDHGAHAGASPGWERGSPHAGRMCSGRGLHRGIGEARNRHPPELILWGRPAGRGRRRLSAVRPHG